jgi:ArsR family transcriptional regulator, arsenate/arsenite/antimonite-responsive transcriptional repressor
MQDPDAIVALSALAHESRLRIFRLLSKQGEQGLPAGKIALKLGLPDATLSYHVNQLLSAGLLLDRHKGASIIYSLNVEGMKGLLSFLLNSCCGPQAELCQPSLGKPAKKHKASPKSAE